jgi:hypothetical protein
MAPVHLVLIIFLPPPYLAFVPVITQSIDVISCVSPIVDDISHVWFQMSRRKEIIRCLGDDLLITLRVRCAG